METNCATPLSGVDEIVRDLHPCADGSTPTLTLRLRGSKQVTRDEPETVAANDDQPPLPTDFLALVAALARVCEEHDYLARIAQEAAR